MFTLHFQILDRYLPFSQLSSSDIDYRVTDGKITAILSLRIELKEIERKLLWPILSFSSTICL